MRSAVIPISGGGARGIGENAEAGPSTEVRISRRGSGAELSPSSAPPTTSVIAVTHPSQYIHTQHPRRASLTPLGLHVISPVPPGQLTTSLPSPVRNVGFNPSGPIPELNVSSHDAALRRGSTASTCSTLTQSKPIGVGPASPAFYPAGFNRERRRSSLTPTLPTLAAASPTRALVSGRILSHNNGADEIAHSRSRTAEAKPLLSATPATDGAYGRRGSLPAIDYGGWTGPTTRTWNPSLPPQRGSFGDEPALPNEGFKFGAGVSGSSTAVASLKAVDLSSSSPRSLYPSPSKKRDVTDVFDEAEAEEAERQRRAFLAATYGADGRRARERLSFAGGGGNTPDGSPGTPGANLRRQSLLLWEKINMTAAARGNVGTFDDDGSGAMLGIAKPAATLGDELGARRLSLPMAIPGVIASRSPSRRKLMAADMDKPPKTKGDPSEEEDEVTEGEEEEEDDDDDVEKLNQDDPFRRGPLEAPLRPLPPLLPLSDPGPRLLPSTLALHRASHLLSSRNLQAEPLPHPLPASLHPPAPVDVAEFDIDFIMAGSLTQLGSLAPLGIDKTFKNAPVDVVKRKEEIALPQTPTLKLGPGGEDEDSFAKFVGEFDDEYGDRRGEWTFRACAAASASDQSTEPFGVSQAARPKPRAEWESIGAGKYELFASGEVRSVQNGRVWRVHQVAKREYELEEMKRGQEVSGATNLGPDSAVKPTIISSGDSYTLASKTSHRDKGGVKLPSSHPSRETSSMSTAAPPRASTRLRVSISDSVGTERTARLGSQDSTITATAPVSRGVPPSSALFSTTETNRSIRDEAEASPASGRDSFSTALGRPVNDPKKKDKVPRSHSKERESDDKAKKDRSLGGVLKRGIFASIKNSVAAHDERRAQREDKERERAQSHSWSPAGTMRPGDFLHPSGKGISQVTTPGRSARSVEKPRSDVKTTGNDDASNKMTPLLLPLAEEDKRGSTPSLGDADLDGSSLVEGKAWNVVPIEAVAMVVPIENDEPRPASTPHDRHPQNNPFFVEGTRQALLVWYVPFNSEGDDRPALSNISVLSTRPPSDPASTKQPVEPNLTSMPKFSKLLRRRASKEKEALKREKAGGPRQLEVDPTTPSKPAYNYVNPLPFRSFRVVARVVDVDDLCAESDLPATSFDLWQEQQRGDPDDSTRATSPLSSDPSPIRPQPSLPSTDEVDAASSSTAPTSTILAGRSFPTVIAVCHSRSQGVEFVLEGLDRLGFCKGESAWGPTGYEEWRGTGLSDKGRELLDLLWAGCTGVMGLTGK